MREGEFFAPAKLNLFLHVTGRRADGYHLLQSLFVLLDVGDWLSIAVRDDGVVRRRNPIAGIAEDNDLSIRAARALQTATNGTLGADIGLTKVIPTGAGLGGGSADAASVLLALNRLWKLHLPNQKLREIGLSLGADVPFFLFGRPAFAEGVGEVLTPLPVPCWWYVVLTPDCHVPTPFVFSQPDLTRTTPPVKIADFSQGAQGEWVGLVDALMETRNDLQAVVLKAFPAVAASLAALSGVSKKSVFGARMTGSGAGVFAAFVAEQDARDAWDALQQLSPDTNGIAKGFAKGFVARGLDQHPLLA